MHSSTHKPEVHGTCGLPRATTKSANLVWRSGLQSKICAFLAKSASFAALRHLSLAWAVFGAKGEKNADFAAQTLPAARILRFCVT